VNVGSFFFKTFVWFGWMALECDLVCGVWRRQNMAWVVPKEHFLPLHALSHNGIYRYRYFSVSFFCDLQLCSGNNKVSVCDT
jgi:hypothetical protein